jgi:hypothetical protein
VDLASVINQRREADGVVAAARQRAAIFCEIRMRLSAESRYADELAGAWNFNGIIRRQRLHFHFMKNILVLFFSFILVTDNLLCQTNPPARKLLHGFDAASQINVEVVADGTFDGEVPCPPEYTNVISNTNLFTPDEQKLLNDIVLNYGNEESNTVPPGSVLVSFEATPIHTSWGTNWDWVARIQSTNSDLTDEIRPGGDLFRHKVRNKTGDGYDFNITPTKFDLVSHDYAGVAGPEFWFQQIKHGVKDGLHVSVVHGDHCSGWMRYSNAWAVDKWLGWDPNKPYLIIWAKFKEPFDIDRTHDRNLQAAVEMATEWATNALNAVPPKPPSSAEQLRSEIESGFKDKNLNAVISLICWDGMEKEMKEMMGFGFAQLMTSGGTNTASFSLAPLPANFQMTISSYLPDWEGDNGTRGKYNIPVLGIIRMKYPGGEAKERTLDMPYGKKGEAYYFAKMVGYQIPGKALRVRVDNIPRSLTYTGYWTYVREGKEISIPISDQTNEFRQGWGDYVKYCYVQRTSTNETPGFASFFQYQITEGQITNMFVGTHQFTEEVPVIIFDSGQITDEKPVIYERK